MNKSYIKSSYTGKYFVKGAGFTTTSKAEASQLTCDEISAARKLGYEPFEVEAVSKSFAVNYVRAGDIDGRGNVIANRNNPSPHRFATEAEARGHGQRYVIENAHKGYYVTETTDPVNSRFDGHMRYTVK